MEFNLIYKEPRYKSAHIHIKDSNYFNCLSYYLPPSEPKRDAFVTYDQIIKNPKIVNKQIARARLGKKNYSSNVLKLMAKFNSFEYACKVSASNASTQISNFSNNVKNKVKDKLINRVTETDDDAGSAKIRIRESESDDDGIAKTINRLPESDNKSTEDSEQQNQNKEPRPTLKQRFSNIQDKISDFGERTKAKLATVKTEDLTEESQQPEQETKQNVPFRQKLRAKKENLIDFCSHLKLKLKSVLSIKRSDRENTDKSDEKDTDKSDEKTN